MSFLWQDVTAGDVQECLAQVEAARDGHSRWLSRLHRSLICGERADSGDLAPDSHRKCKLGRWYYSCNDPAVCATPEFAAIGAHHERMHELARALLCSDPADGVVDPAAYLAFSDAAARLRERLRELETALVRRLRTVSRLLENAFERTGEAVMITAPDGTVLDVNRSFTEVTGYGRAEIIGKSANHMRSGRHDEHFYRSMWVTLRNTGRWQGEIWNRRKSGEAYLERLSIAAVRDDIGRTTHFIATFADITANRANEERLHRLGYYDALTDLPNRILFRDRLQQGVARAGRRDLQVAVMFLDLDRFKVINDTLGHNIGDALLVDVARRVTGCVRESDTVARMGGDEFAVLVPDLDDARKAGHIAQKILDVLTDPFQVGGHEFFLTGSIGISVYPIHGTAIEALTKSADLAMYDAKREGGNRFQFCHSNMSAETAARFALEKDLHKALERDEFVLYYQPKVDVETCEVTGIEALLRWRHPTDGLVPPLTFIPVAEETGLIIPIGEWVLREACAQNKEWQDAGLPPVRVSVNLSARQLKQKALPHFVAAALRETGLEPRWLELELTESSVMQNPEEAIAILRELKAMGVCISIDDFGTGYSSLSYLKQLPVDTIKIDKSFIQNVVGATDDAALSQGIIALSRSLKLEVLAEGVETAEQLAFLRNNDCRDAQGYYFSRPIPADELRDLLRQGRRIGPEEKIRIA